MQMHHISTGSLQRFVRHDTPYWLTDDDFCVYDVVVINLKEDESPISQNCFRRRMCHTYERENRKINPNLIRQRKRIFIWIYRIRSLEMTPTNTAWFPVPSAFAIQVLYNNILSSRRHCLNDCVCTLLDVRSSSNIIGLTLQCAKN